MCTHAIWLIESKCCVSQARLVMAPRVLHHSLDVFNWFADARQPSWWRCPRAHGLGESAAEAASMLAEELAAGMDEATLEKCEAAALERFELEAEPLRLTRRSLASETIRPRGGSTY